MLRKFALIYLVSIIMLAWGIGIGKFKIFPYHLISETYKEFQAFKTGLSKDQSLSEIVSNLFQEKVFSAPKAQLIGNFFPTQAGLSIENKAKTDGYLLLAGLDKQDNRHAVKLMELETGSIVHKWRLDYDTIFSETPKDGGSYKLFSPERTRIFHPLLLNDGSLIFNTQEGPLVKIDVCSRHDWTNNHHFHHSIEMDDTGDIWTNSVIYDQTTGYPRVHLWDKVEKVRDDGYARLNQDGEILEEKSILQILEDNGYTGLLYGTRLFVEDRIHANDVTPARYSTEYWKKGDLLISLRDISTVLLYRPSTGKILWLKTGPWLFQHDADFVGDSKISIFSNQTLPEDGEFTGKGASDIFVYDFSTDHITRPYAEILKRIGFYSRAEGRARVLPDGRLYLEETIRGRMLMVTPDELVWSYVNRYDAGNVGQVSWSRFYQDDEISQALLAIQQANCKNTED